MSIGSTIKRLRREKNITQEQLAEYLGITSRAISQWECDRTAPDISQLPALCHIFDVSSDLLLGIDIEKNNEEIKKYLTEAANLGYQGKGSERTELLREANKRFPRDYKIMERLANAIVCEYSRKGIKEYDEVFDLCNRILSECTDSNIRYRRALPRPRGPGTLRPQPRCPHPQPHPWLAYRQLRTSTVRVNLSFLLLEFISG